MQCEGIAEFFPVVLIDEVEEICSVPVIPNVDGVEVIQSLLHTEYEAAVHTENVHPVNSWIYTRKVHGELPGIWIGYDPYSRCGDIIGQEGSGQ